MAKFDFNGFIRECYLRSEPSVDLNEVTSDNPIDCCKHRLAETEYEKILQEYGVTDERGNAIEHDWLCGCNMWMLQSGPQLYNAKVA